MNRWIGIFVLVIGWQLVAAPAEAVVSLSFDAAAFKEGFNAAADKGRLVAVLSPT